MPLLPAVASINWLHWQLITKKYPVCTLPTTFFIATSNTITTLFFNFLAVWPWLWLVVRLIVGFLQ
jgi:hypothetical protein